MGLYDHWPYTNFHELNLSWLLRRIEALSNEVENFVALNTIKYADPIQWNITSQYEANTVVVDPQSGTAYISSRPVPAGVALTNTDYWSVIFTLDMLSANDNITFRDDGSNILSTFSSVAGDWLLWNGNLYRVSRNINVNEAYVVGYNLTRYTVELFIKDYIQDVVTQLSNTTGDLTDLDTTDKSNLVAAINEVLRTAIDANIYAFPEDYGAAGDGVTDDSAAVQAAVNTGKIVYLKNSYAINNINITSTTTIIGSDTSKIYPNTVSGTTLYKNVFTASANLILDNLHFEGQGIYSGTGNERYTLIDCSNSDYFIMKNCRVEDIGHDYVSTSGATKDYIPIWIRAIDVQKVIIDKNEFIDGGCDELMTISPWYTSGKPIIELTNNIFTDCTHGASLNLLAYDVLVDHNTFNNFVYGGSIFNLTGENVNCTHNNFNACTVGSVFDGLEGCELHAENFNVLYNNFTGSCNIFAENVGSYTQVIGNNLEANTLLFNELTVVSSVNIAPSLRNTRVRSHGKCIIKGNSMTISGGNAPVIRAYAINANGTSDIPVTDYTMNDLLIVDGNNFDFTSFMTINNKFFISVTALINNVLIANNLISNPNRDSLGASAKWILYVDNRFIGMMKSVAFINNALTDLDASFTNGIGLYTTIDPASCVQTAVDIANTAYNSTVAVGTTNYVTLKQL